MNIQILDGAWTWDGTTLVTMFPMNFETGKSCSTDQISPGDYLGVDREGPWFKIIEVIEEAGVVLDNPNGVEIPVGFIATFVRSERTL